MVADSKCAFQVVNHKFLCLRRFHEALAAQPLDDHVGRCRGLRDAFALRQPLQRLMRLLAAFGDWMSLLLGRYLGG